MMNNVNELYNPDGPNFAKQLLDIIVDRSNRISDQLNNIKCCSVEPTISMFDGISKLADDIVQFKIYFEELEFDLED